ncbi:protein of unknown function DUF223 [Abeliophyllum distichum]|uniref:DUF223 domain-containing protein n=1 Tax=Abeliophyllum distichum TaxID=126358 RepID=A0ABD1V8G5_9LAMI
MVGLFRTRCEVENSTPYPSQLASRAGQGRAGRGFSPSLSARVYYICDENFVIWYNTMKFKATTHEYKLNFMSKTQVIKVGDDSVPLQIHVFRPFGELLSAPDVDETELFSNN